MKPRSIYIFNLLILLLLFSGKVYAQKDPQTSNTSFAVDFGVDLSKFTSFLLDFEQKYEIQAGILLLEHFRLNGEYGFAELAPEKSFENSESKDEGFYRRAGIDYFINFDPKNKFLIGIKYGKSNFDDEIQTNFESSIWQGFKETKKDLTADWYEFSLSTESQIKNNLFFGVIFRLRILNEFDNPGILDVFAIPGYGHTFDDSVPAFNVYLRYRLPLAN